MALPPIETLCKALEPSQMDLCLTFPGGAEICAEFESFPPSLLALARSLLTQASAGLAPLGPVFSIIEAIVAVGQCIQGINDALAKVPPDPSKLVDCIPNLLAKIEALLRLLPALSFPLLILGLIDAIIVLLQGIRNELAAIIYLVERITRARAAGSDILSSLIDCAETTQMVEMSNLERLFGSINSLIELINQMGQSAGLPEIPSFSGGFGGDPYAALEPLDALLEILNTFRGLLPVSASDFLHVHAST